MIYAVNNSMKSVCASEHEIDSDCLDRVNYGSS